MEKQGQGWSPAQQLEIESSERKPRYLSLIIRSNDRCTSTEEPRVDVISFEVDDVLTSYVRI